MPIIAVTSDEERLLMRKEAQQTLDKNHARRLIAMLMLHQGMTVTDVARTLCAARSSVGRLRIFLSSCPCWYNVPHSILAGFSLAGARSCWLASSTGFLAWFSIPPNLRRHLKMAGIIWRRAAPTLIINDPHYEKKRLAIRLALARKQTEHPVFYQEEVDINLNPKSVRTGCVKGNRNVSPHRGRTRSIIWLGHYILAPKNPLRQRQQ